MRLWTDEAGLSLTEILVAVALMGIGLAALLQGIPIGVHALAFGRQKSTALLHAEAKIEAIRAQALSDEPGQGFGSIANGQPCCTPEDPIRDGPGYRRTVTVTDDGPQRKVVRVQVFYRPITGQGVLSREESAELATMIACHDCS